LIWPILVVTGACPGAAVETRLPERFNMESFYPQVGVRFNPTFTQLQFAMFARDVEGYAAQTYQAAFAAFARAADGSQGPIVERRNFALLTQTGQILIALYRIAVDDARINETKVGQRINLLFWAIIGATEQLLSFDEDNGDWEKDWRSGLDRGGLFARLVTDLALAGAAVGTERDEMIDCLSRLRVSTGKVRDYHLYLIREVPEDFYEPLGLAAEAGRLSTMLEDAAVQLRACAALEPATS
jgi:hypothetical protein